jgi:hypothetical protein
MSDGNFKKLFIATHLLYPNSAQARDIVFQISTQLRNKVNKSGTDGELLVYYSALVQIYKKVVSIKSGFKFFEFKDQKLNDWQSILKKCNSNEVLIFLAIAVLKLDIESIAQVMKISVNQTYYLFSLAIRKSVGSNEAKQALSYSFQYKKFNEKQNTFSNLIERAVEYIYLKKQQSHSLDDFIKEQAADIEKGNLNGISYIFKKIESLYLEVNQIEIDEKFLEEFKKETLEFFEGQKLSYKVEWKYTGIILIVSCSLLFFYIKPNFSNFLNLYDSYSVIEIKEIAFRNPENQIDGVTKFENESGSQLSDQLAEFRNLNPDIEKPSEKSNEKPNEKNLTDLKFLPLGPTAAPKPEVAKPSEKLDAALAKTAAAAPSGLGGGLTASASTESASDRIKSDEKKNQPKMVGGLYRAELKVKDFEQNTLFAKEKIINYGGKKAGEVELGWVKNQKTAYFHFSIPEENIEKMKSDLELLGRLEISFHPHPRLMPVGTKRVILEVKLVD